MTSRNILSGIKEKTAFGRRLKEAFGNATNGVIGKKIGVAENTVGFYVRGRIPDADILIKIADVTGRSIDWLLRGEASQTSAGLNVSSQILERLRTIAGEQSNVVYGDVDLAGGNLTERTLDLLTEYLLSRALRSVNLVESETEVMSASDVKRAERFTFVANIPQSMDDRIREIIARELSGKNVSPAAQEKEIRDMIRDIVKEEISQSRMRPVFPLVLTDSADDEDEARPRRKAG